MKIKNDLTHHAAAMLNSNKQQALRAMGREAVQMIQGGMLTLYPKPPYDTGALLNDVQAGNLTADSIEVGNTLHYAPYVHEGTSRMAGRPYIRDSLFGAYAIESMKTAAGDELKKGF